jgi:hypothetical protein
MFRMALGVGSVAILVLSAAGCQMCCHPYDQSGPVFCDDGCSASCQTRAGSILADSPEASALLSKNSAPQKPVSPTPAPAQAKTRRPSISYVMTGRRADSPSPALVEAKKPQKPFSYAKAGSRPEGPQLGPAQPGDVPGSERIVSVTERTVGPSADSSQAATEAPQEASLPLPANRWTARRPTTELLR